MIKRFLLSLFIVCSLTEYAYAQTELDYMEYANDGAAQTAYVSSDISADVIEKSITTRDDEGGIIGEVGTFEKRAQEFQVSVNITCAKAAVEIRKNNSPTDDIIVRIETDAAGLPSGTLVHANATKSLSASAQSTSWTWVDFVFPDTFSLTSGTVYHLVMERSGVRDISNLIMVGLDASAPPEQKAEASNSGTWEDKPYDLIFKVYKRIIPLQCYSEDTIKQQGSYSLKVVAAQTDSLNDTLTKSGLAIDLSGLDTIEYDIYALRTGSNIKISIHDSGGTTTEHTANVASSNTNQTESWNISGVADANKDAIDWIKVTIIDADSDNIFYIDNIYAESGEVGQFIMIR